MKTLQWALLLSATSLLASPARAEPQASDPLLAKDEPRKLEGHTKDQIITALAFAPDGQLLASASCDGTVRIWDLRTSQTIHVLKGVGEQAYAVAFSPDGKLLATAGKAADIKVWKVGTWEEAATLRGHKESVACLAFSPDGTLLASGSYDRAICLWAMPQGELKHRLTGHTGRVTGLAFSPDGKRLVSGGTGISPDNIALSERVREWDAAAGKLLRTLEARADRVDYSPDGRTLALAQRSHIEVYPYVKGAKPKGQLRVGDQEWDVYGIVRLVDAASGDEFFQAPSRGGEVRFAPDGRTFALGQGLPFHQQGSIISGGPYESDYRLSIWETVSQTELLKFDDEYYSSCLAFSPSERVIAAGTCYRGAVFIWKPRPIKPVPALPAQLSKEDLTRLWNDLASSPRSAFAVTAALAERPEVAVGLLRERLKPVPEAEGQRISQLLGQLDSERFTLREQATQELRRLGHSVEPALRRALADGPSAQATTALQGLLRQARKNPGPEALRDLRAVGVLEHLATPEAVRLLEALAQGSPAFALTQDARHSLARLRQGR